MGRSMEWRRSVRQLVAAGYRQGQAGEGYRPCRGCGVTIWGRRVWRTGSGRPAAGLCRRCATIQSLVGRLPIAPVEPWAIERVAEVVREWRISGFDPQRTFDRTMMGASVVLAAIDEWALRELVRPVPTVERRELRWMPTR